MKTENDTPEGITTQASGTRGKPPGGERIQREPAGAAKGNTSLQKRNYIENEGGKEK